MVTAFTRKKDSKKVLFVTQQYQVGLYLAIYTEGQSIPEQTGIDTDNEPEFHRDLRQNYNKRQLIINTEKSSPLPAEKNTE